MAHTAAISVVTSRCRNRIAAHMTKGSTRNVNGREGMYGAALSLNIACVVNGSAAARLAPSVAFCGDHDCRSRAHQLRMRGVTRMIPMASPCHQVHQFQYNSGTDSEGTRASGT